MSKLILNLFAFTLFLGVSLTAKTDLTLSDKAHGKDVVEAVDILIKTSGIFGDNNGFLIRMAFVATQFGNDSDTFTTKGNIWGLTQTNFDKTTSIQTTLTTSYAKIKQIFQIDWTGIKYSDLSKPLIGGLAATIFMALNDPVPIYLMEQGNYYNKYFSPSTTAQQFYDKVKVMEKLYTCQGRMNLVIVIDGSGSIGAGNFDLAKDFVTQLVSTFSLTNVNLGIIVFSTNTEVTLPLNNNLQLADLTTKIKNIVYPGQNTHTSVAIKTAQDMLLKSNRSDGSPMIMTIFTDGDPNGPGDPTATIEAAKQAINSDITLFAVGIGNSIQQDQLLKMVMNEKNRIFSMSSYKDLSESFDLMNGVTCKIGQKPEIGKKIDDSLNKNEKRYFCYDLPQIGITITIEEKVGKTESYYSYTQQNPSSALNDGKINGKTFIPALQTGYRAKRDTTTKRICVTVEGLEIHNNFTIDSEEGNKEVIATTDSPFDPIGIKALAKQIAEESLKTPNIDNYQLSNHICNTMSETYSKWGWICVIGHNVSVSERLENLELFQLNFKLHEIDFYFMINIP